MICPNCYYHGKPKMLAKGSLLIAIILLVFVFPIGLIYIIFCSIGPKNICPKCDTPLIPEDSPKAIEIIKQLEVNKNVRKN
jgi:flagellar basal body-associated protein FliL